MTGGLKPYRGLLSPAEVAQGINAAQRNAVALAEEARLLLDAGRFPRASSLAALSIEESGKVSILRSIALARSPQEAKEEWQRYRRHTEKNQAWVLPSLVSDGAKHVEDFRRLFDHDSDHPQLLDHVKQIGFYTDCLGQKNWSEPRDVVDSSLAQSLVQTAELLAGHREVTPEEIELWVQFLGPVWKGPFEWMKKALVNWHRAAVERGLIEADSDDMERFIYGAAEPDV